MKLATAVLATAAAVGGILAVSAWRRGTSPAAEPAPTRKTAPRILVGDSLAVGLAPHLRALGVISDSRAVSGTTVAHWLAKGLSPGRYLVSLGTNDLAGAGLKREQVERLGEKLGDSVWVVPPPMPFDKYEEAVEILKGQKAIDTPGGLPRAADKIHLPPNGYRQWAAAIAAELQTRGE